MKNALLLTIFLFFWSLTIAQVRPEAYIGMLPPVPGNVCSEDNRQEKVVITATGTCDNLPQKTETVPREITIPLKVIFGPYPGKSTDKVLQQKDTIEETNPATNEKSTITIDFSLTSK